MFKVHVTQGMARLRNESHSIFFYDDDNDDNLCGARELHMYLPVPTLARYLRLVLFNCRATNFLVM